MNTTNQPHEKVNIYDVFEHARDEKHAFFTSDLLVGSAALWVPLLLSVTFLSNTNPWNEFIKLLDSGGAYTFSLAYLAAGSSFLYLERRQKTINDFRDEICPNLWTWNQLYLIVGIALTGSHFAYQILIPNKTNFVLNLLELLYFILAIRFGLQLFCLRNIHKLPGKLELYRKREEEKTKEIAAVRGSDELY